jgi:DNA-binding response OmpR family regulator
MIPMSRQKQARRILIVEDDGKTAGVLELYFKHAGYETILATNGRSALDLARSHAPDLIVLDLMLPLVSGLDVCRMLRSESGTPVIILTARSTEEDKLIGLDLGADDYVTKPFSPREVVARVRAVLRRTGEKVGPGEASPREEQLRSGDLVIDLVNRGVTVGGRVISLTPTEFRLLETLMGAPARTFTRSELVERAFGWDYDGLDRTVDAHIMNLRKKLDAGRGQPSPISTVFGVGYRLAGGDDDT